MQFQACVYCKQPCTGAHTCVTCGKMVHAIAPCSISNDENKGYGSKVTCAICWFDSDRDHYGRTKTTKRLYRHYIEFHPVY